jgi:hypothetical protein
MDETVAGNPLRPDRGRSFACFYWTIYDLPSHFFSSQDSWHTVCIVATATLERIAGGASHIMHQIVELMWSSTGHNLATAGVDLPFGDDLATTFRLYLDLGAICSDEKALKELGCATGASGAKPCLRCCNLVGRCDARLVANHPFLVHLESSEWRRFQPTSSALCASMLSDIREAWANSSRREAATLETRLGLHAFDVPTMLSGHCMQVARWPELVYFDPMHNMFASGGICQFVLNTMIWRITAAGIPAARVEDFIRSMVFPGRRTLKKFFLRHRLAADGHHIRAFASESSDLLSTMLLFGQVVLAPAQALAEWLPMLTLLHHLAQVLGGLVYERDATQLKDLLATLHEALRRLCPPAVRPKLHFLYHSIEGLCTQGVPLACYGVERRHKLGKSIGAVSYKQFSKTILIRSLLVGLHRLDSGHYKFCGYRLDGKVSPSPPIDRCPAGHFRRSRALSTPRGRLTVGDIVRMDAQQAWGKVIHCLEHNDDYLCYCQWLRLIAGQQLELTMEFAFVYASHIARAIPYLLDGNMFQILREDL